MNKFVTVCQAVWVTHEQVCDCLSSGSSATDQMLVQNSMAEWLPKLQSSGRQEWCPVHIGGAKVQIGRRKSFVKQRIRRHEASPESLNGSSFVDPELGESSQVLHLFSRGMTTLTCDAHGTPPPRPRSRSPRSGCKPELRTLLFIEESRSPRPQWLTDPSPAPRPCRHRGANVQAPLNADLPLVDEADTVSPHDV